MPCFRAWIVAAPCKVCLRAIYVKMLLVRGFCSSHFCTCYYFLRLARTKSGKVETSRAGSEAQAPFGSTACVAVLPSQTLVQRLSPKGSAIQHCAGPLTQGDAAHDRALDELRSLPRTPDRSGFMDLHRGPLSPSVLPNQRSASEHTRAKYMRIGLCAPYELLSFRVFKARQTPGSCCMLFYFASKGL